MYGVTKFLIGAGVLLLGMILGGGGQKAASIISHIDHWVVHHVLFTAIILIPIAFWHGHERAIGRYGAHEMAELRKDIYTGGG